MDKEMQDQVKVKKSRSLLEMGEISRIYRAFDTDLERKQLALLSQTYISPTQGKMLAK